MKKVILVFGTILIFLTACVTKKVTLTNKTNNLVDVYLDGKFIKSIDSSEVYSFNYKENFPISIDGRLKSGEVIHNATLKLISNNQVSNSNSKNTKVNTQETENNATFSDLLIDLWFTAPNNQLIETTGYGYLKLETNEENVDIFLDDIFIGKISQGSLNKKVQVGKHNLMAKKEFYMPNSINFEIKDKEVFQHIFSLQTVAGWSETKPGFTKTQQARGNLTVVTEKSDFVVFIEGVQKIPPFELKNMPAGKYNLKIVCKDFEKFIEVTVPFKETEFVDLDVLFPR